MSSGKKRAVTQSEGSAWQDDSSDDDGDAASLGPSPDDVCLSQTDNVTPAREKKRRRSSGAGVGADASIASRIVARRTASRARVRRRRRRDGLCRPSLRGA